MKQTLLLICDAGPEKRRFVEDLINTQPSLELTVTVAAEQARDEIGRLKPTIVWLELSPSPVRGLCLLADLKEAFPQVYFLVSYEILDAEMSRTAYRLGAFDFLDAKRCAVDLPAVVQSIEEHQTKIAQLLSHLVNAMHSKPQAQIANRLREASRR